MKLFAKIILWIFAGLGGLMTVSVIAGIIFATNIKDDVATIEEGSVLWIDLGEYIPERSQASGFFNNSNQPTFIEHLEAIEAATYDEKIVAIAAELTGRGLGMAQVQELRSALLRFQTNSGKKTYLYAEDLGAMGNGMISYYLASAFSEIWLNPTGGVGVNGLAIEMPYFADALEKLDIKAEMAQRHEYKGGADPFIRSHMTSPVRHSLQNLLDQWQKQMSNDILASRWNTEADFKQLIDNSPYLPQQSLDLGLVDKLAYLDEYEDMLDGLHAGTKGKTVSINYYLHASNALEGEFHFSGETEDTQIASNIALIHGIGPITGEDHGSGYYTDDNFSPYTVAKALADAREDKTIEAVLFRVSSPGGAYAQSDMVRREVLKLKEAGKPIIVSMGNDAASGGYFVSMGADHIIAHPGTLTGSIGVYAGKVATKRLWDSLGVNWQRVETGPQAGMWSMVSDFTPSQRKKFQESLDFVYDDFSGKAAADRGLSPEEIDQAARGRIWTGNEAINAKLIDELGGYNEAMEAIRRILRLNNDTTLNMVNFPTQPTPMEKLKTILSSDDPMQFISTTITDSLIETRMPQWAKAIKAQFDGSLEARGVLTMPQFYISD